MIHYVEISRKVKQTKDLKISDAILKWKRATVNPFQVSEILRIFPEKNVQDLTPFIIKKVQA